MDYLIDFSESEADEIWTEHVFSNQPIDPNDIWEHWLGVTVDKGFSEKRRKPTSEQQLAINTFVENQDAVFEAITTYILVNWRQIEFGYLPGENENPDYVRTLNSKEDVKRQLSISALCVKKYKRDGLAYTGYFGNCEWDPEHGCGILMLGNRIINVGGHDAAYSGYQEIKADGGVPIITNVRETKMQQKQPPIASITEDVERSVKWWEFWKN